MTHLGPLIARSLVYNIGGHAARSELDKLCEPLKRLVSTCVGAQGWLLQALGDNNEGGFPGAERVGVEERAGWVRRVVA
jgi:hypothetical protein